MVQLLRIFSKGRENLQYFASDKRGNIAIIFALVLTPLIGMIGLSIDGLRAYNAAETAVNALDAAALAAAKAMAEQDLDPDEVAELAKKFFAANVQGSRAVSNSVYDALDVQADPATGNVTISVKARVPTTFSAIFNVNEMTIDRSSTVAAGLNDIDLGLMLDVTGSMSRRGKLRAMKNATYDLIDMIIPDGRRQSRVRIALAPYSEQVNVGRFALRISDARNRSGCVVERNGPHANSDVPPMQGSQFHVMTDEEKDRYTDETRRRNLICPPAEIEPLTSDAERLKRIVSGYRANGYTAGHLGIQWAWNLISPEWSAVWPSGSTPEPYDRKGVIKAVVLMTDGEFNTAYSGSWSRSGMKRESYSNTGELCDNIKAENVIIFSVAFDLNDAKAERALQDCSSGAGYFHRAENEEELRMAYRDIAIKLTELRIAK